MDVTLHIGLPKTATTFLQHWLDVNAHAFADRLALLPTQRGGHLLATLCCDEERFGKRPDYQAIGAATQPAQIVEQLDTMRAAGVERLIISSEYFFNAEPSKVKAAFERFGLSVETILCFFRRQDRLIASGYAQDIKMLARAAPMKNAGYRPIYDWLALQAAYRLAFPHGRFVPLEFDHLRRTATLVQAWKRGLRIDDVATQDVVAGNAPVNESLPGEMVELCRIANKLGLPSLTGFALRAAQVGIVGKRFDLPLSTRMSLRDTYASLNDRFVAQLEDAHGFQDYTSAGWRVDDDESLDLQPEQIAQLIALALDREKSAS